MASRSIDDLAAPVRAAALRLQTACGEAGIDLLIYCTLRSLEEQEYLYAQGRSRPGQIITKSPPGKSLHNPDKNGKAWAFDAVPLIAGKAAWHDDFLLEWVGVLGERCGLEWAGRWRGDLRERVHFQIRSVK